MTISVVSAFPAAARMMCSSCGRFTCLELANDAEALLWREDAAERRRLPKASGTLVGGFQEPEQLADGRVQQGLPFEQIEPGAGRTGLQPARHVGARLLHECRLRSQFRRD